MPSKAKTLSEIKRDQECTSDRHAYSANHSKAKEIRNSARWQKYRKYFKRKNPICCDPLNLHPNEVRMTQQVHHIIGIEKRPDLAFKYENLASLCTACHSKIEAKERKGEPTQGLFKGQGGMKIARD